MPEEDTNRAPETDEASAAPKASAKKRNKKWVVPTVVVAIIVVIGVGFFAWHNTPGFCNSVCHSPMDTYVESYSSGDRGMLVTAHAEAGLSCLDCHEAKLNEQVTEVIAWSSDTFTTTADGHLVDANVDRFASPENCLKSGCHDWNDVVDSTWGFAGNDAKYNPHASHQDGSVQCSDCHKSHETSTLYCAKCHDMNLPEGWEATTDAA